MVRTAALINKCPINGYIDSFKLLRLTSSPAKRKSDEIPKIASKPIVGSCEYSDAKILTAIPKMKQVSGAGILKRCRILGVKINVNNTLKYMI